MSLQEPKSMDECVYFTNRNIGEGKVKAWVFKEKCIKCGKELMGKPKDEKTGKPKIRANLYVCGSCGYRVDKDEYEESLSINIRYTCPKCSNSNELSIPFKRKKVVRIDEDTGKKETVESVRFLCNKCNEKIDVTKKMK